MGVGSSEGGVEVRGTRVGPSPVGWVDSGGGKERAEIGIPAACIVGNQVPGTGTMLQKR